MLVKQTTDIHKNLKQQCSLVGSMDYTEQRGLHGPWKSGEEINPQMSCSPSQTSCHCSEQGRLCGWLGSMPGCCTPPCHPVSATTCSTLYHTCHLYWTSSSASPHSTHTAPLCFSILPISPPRVCPLKWHCKQQCVMPYIFLPIQLYMQILITINHCLVQGF